MTVLTERAQVVEAALEFVGTPFRHATRLKGVGIDCAQLLVAAFAPVVQVTFDPYPAAWFLHSNRERLLEVIQRYCVVAEPPFAPGDIATFRFGRTVSHAGIVATVDPLTVVHAFQPAHKVTVHDIGAGTALASRLTNVWRLTRWAD